MGHPGEADSLSGRSSLERKLTRLSLFAGSIGTIVPGVSFFVEEAPPLFNATGLLTSGVAVAVLIWGFNQRLERSRIPRRAVVSVVGALVLIVSYRVCLAYLTVLPPRQGNREQIGFFMSNWSLTKSASEFIRRTEGDIRTPQELMLAYGGFGDRQIVWTIWEPWTIVSAGSILILLFVLSFLLWSYAFAILAQYIGNRKSPSGRESRVGGSQTPSPRSGED